MNLKGSGLFDRKLILNSCLELSEYHIAYEGRTSIKGQVLADFIAELTPKHQTDDHIPWVLHVDAKNGERKLEEQERKKLEHSGQSPHA
ncbi:hypothetical protein PIB30_073130 [Stylosanthes scabra]|uniref:Uncharacterized protein n=1 Tax=Stylosanthes scabra TaxID=79078 RepID=A0ABU6TPE6_9FABA|nr:hypothetical protein [Stylosanthes scabra]